MRLALIFILLLAQSAAAASKPDNGDKNAGATPLYGELSYRDGAENRRVWLDPKAFLEFDGTPAVAQLMRKLDASAKPRAIGKNRLWLLAGIDAATAREVVLRKLPKARLSPVYRDAPATTGRARALTGELIVTVRGQGPATAQFLAEHGLVLVRTLPPETHAAVVRPKKATDPLALADGLSKVDGVASATAVWWLESAPR